MVLPNTKRILIHDDSEVDFGVYTVFFQKKNIPAIKPPCIANFRAMFDYQQVAIIIPNQILTGAKPLAPRWPSQDL
jgi:hypothetical protein